MQQYTGGCHCGKVHYTVEADIKSVIACNCSHCAAKGLLLVFVPKESFSLSSGEETLTEYRFNKRTITHLFCSVCGVEAFGYGQDQEGHATVAINVRSIDDIDLEHIAQMPFDGKHLM